MQNNKLQQRFEDQLSKKCKAARDLSWTLLEAICSLMHPPLHKIKGVAKLDANSLPWKDIRSQLDEDFEPIRTCLVNQLECYINISAKLKPEHWQAIYHCILAILENLKQHKLEHEKLKLEEPIFRYILKMYQVLNLMLSNHSFIEKENTTQRLFLTYSKPTLECISFLKKHCLIISGTKIDNPDLNSDIFQYYMNLIKCNSFLGNKEIIESYLHEIKPVIQDLKNMLQRVMAFEWYYLTKALVAADLHHDYQLAKYYCYKANSQVDILLDLNNPMSEFHMGITNHIWKIIVNKALHLESLEFLHHMIRLLKRNMELGYHKSGPFEFSELLQTFEKATLLTKRALGKHQAHYINQVSHGLIKTEVSENPHDKNLALKMETTDEKLSNHLQNFFHKEHLIFNLVGNTIYLPYFYRLNTQTSLLWIVDNCLAFVNTKLEYGKTPPAVTSYASKEEVSEVNIVEAKNMNDQPNLNQAQAISKLKSTQTQWPPAKKETVIEFDSTYIYRSLNSNCNIYKLYAPYSKHNYVCIDPALIDYLDLNNRYALVDLIHMCEVGHVLGNSKGKKGFILSGKPFKEMVQKTVTSHTKKEDRMETKKPTVNSYIKVKNSSKDWRFFGTEYVKKTIDNKDYTLYIVDSWSPNHKSKAKTISKKVQNMSLNKIGK